MPPLEEADIEGNEIDPEAVLEKPAEDFGPSASIKTDVMVSHNMLAIVDMLTSTVHEKPQHDFPWVPRDLLSLQ